MADDLSLLLRLRGDNAQLKSTIADTRAAVNQLRQSMGPQLTQTVSVANQAFSSISDNLNVFVGQRVPLVGGAFVRITENLRGFGSEGAKAEKAVASVAKSIQSIATESGKTVPQIASFLTKFIQIEGQANRDKEAVGFFGASLAQKLIPQLEETGGAMASVAGEGATAGESIAAMAGPVGIAVLALAALAVGAVVAARELFNLSKTAAEFQGKMFDLAQQTGLAVKTLSALEVEAKNTGGALSTIIQAVVLFQRKLDDTQDPLSKTAEQFRKLGVDTSDTETSLRSAFAALAAMPEGFAQTNAAAELFGARGGKQVLAILKETQGDLDGTIKKLQDLGILISEDDARAADIFNDQLALTEFQMRALTATLTRDVIPVMLEMVKTFGSLLTSIRPVISILGSFTATLLRPVAEVIKSTSLLLQLLSGDWLALAKAIKEAQDAQNIEPLKVPGITPVPLPTAPSPLRASAEAVTSADAVLAEVKRKAAQANQALDELFQRGRADRQQQAESIITDNKRILKADTDRIDAELSQKETEIKALDEAARKRGEIADRETDEYKSINAAVAKLQQERLDKENEFEVTSRALRAKAAQERANARRSQIQNETDLLIKGFDQAIANAEAALKAGAPDEQKQFEIIEKSERAKLDARIKGLQDQKAIGLLTIQEQKDIDNQIKGLNKDREVLDDEQRARRLQREIQTAARNREVTIANLDALIQQEQIVGERRIETLKVLAAQRVVTEENAARKILDIRLGLLDDELEATQAKLIAAKSITNKDERIRTEADLNNQIKILNEQRRSIQAEGDREIENGRQRDLQNERNYADDLKEIKARTRDIERDTAEDVIRLMVLHFAKRKDIIRAQRDQALQDERDRHTRESEIIRQQQQETDQQIKVLEGYLKNLKIGTYEEIEEHDRIIESLEKLRVKRTEIEAQQQKESQLNQTRQRRITTQAKRDETDVEGIFVPGDLLPQLKDNAGIVEAATEGLKAAFTDLKTVGLDAFGSIAQGISSLVQNYVLLGTAGPAALRKLLAATLAQITAESAVRAVYWTAQGIADLFFNPARAGADFAAAALFASIAGVSALAGRGIAGNLFKTSSTGGGNGSGTGAPGEVNPLTLARNAGPGAPQQIAPQVQPIRVTVNVVPDGTKFGQAVTAHVVEDFNNAGPIREVSANDGNLNRG